jgi:folylpolyglutamate synthase/dihydropteroate synthase
MREDCTDMVRLNGHNIPASTLRDYLLGAEDLLYDLRSEQDFTHYMLICAAAYQFFTDTGVDFVVAETAIGGAYDPTVPLQPDICVFTNITHEHLDVLGPSLDHICRHKSRIIGPRSQVVLGEEIDHDQAALIAQYAGRKGALVHAMTASMDGWVDHNVICDDGYIKFVDRDRYCPRYQHPNIRLATRVIQFTQHKFVAPIVFNVSERALDLFPPYRFEIRRRGAVTYVFDCAHNKDSYLKLHSSLMARFDRSELSYLRGAVNQASIDNFRRVFAPERVTYISGYHPRVIHRPGFVDIDELDFDEQERAFGTTVVVVCGIFLCPQVMKRLFPDG